MNSNLQFEYFKLHNLHFIFYISNLIRVTDELHFVNENKKYKYKINLQDTIVNTR